VDCEKFDRVVLDQLYSELDELTSAAAKRHVEHCMRCRRIEAGLRATREIGVLPTLAPPNDMVSQILAAERQAHAVLPVRRRLGRAVSIMAAYAMRPQLAMAALLVLMIGGSLLFLRARPSDRDLAEIAERGVPEGEGDSIPIVPVPEKAPGSGRGSAAQAHGALEDDSREPARRERAKSDETAPEALEYGAESKIEEERSAQATLEGEDAGGDVAYDEAMAAFNAGRFPEAQRRFESIAAAGGAKAAAASLFAAQSARNGSGCGAAAARFEEVANHFPGTGVGNEATWQAADCYRALGELERARRHYRTLLATQYANRAQLALAELEQPEQMVTGRSPAKPAAAKARPNAAAAPSTNARPAEPAE
jgi:tetratricopeptide (TPR) repeat protein